MAEKRLCNVPNCKEIHKARGLCNKHYHVWRDIQLDYDYVDRYVENLTTPLRNKRCNHEKNVANFIIRINGWGKKYKTCRLCRNERDNISRRKRRNALKEQSEQT